MPKPIHEPSLGQDKDAPSQVRILIDETRLLLRDMEQLTIAARVRRLRAPIPGTGCTIEANAFAEATPRSAAFGATVIGISSDTIETLKRFSVEACRNQFAVAADARSKVVQAYDAASTFSRSMAARVSYVIDRSGRVVFTHDSMSPEGHITETLKAVEQLRARPAQSSPPASDRGCSTPAAASTPRGSIKERR